MEETQISPFTLNATHFPEGDIFGFDGFNLAGIGKLLLMAEAKFCPGKSTCHRRALFVPVPV
ncbi:MAG TPA: hypothetical protein EYQ20_10200 [candidate division Zixibacteria bacterium]|nr:hypothetical protein [candidate division Zixibacteria bacterium]